MIPIRLFVAFLVLRTLVLLTASTPGDVRRYYDYTEKRARGLLPYRDFAFEYPPLAYAHISFPRLLAPRASFEDYHRLFRLQSFLLDLFAFSLLAASGAVREELLWAYLVATSVLGPVLYDRLDIALAFLFALVVFLWSRGRIAWASGALGVAGAFKVFGALLFPAFVLAEGCTRPFKARELALRCLAFVAGLVLPALPMVRLVGADVFGFLEYHSQRGIQVESTWATLEMALAVCLRLPREVVWNGGAHDLRTEVSSFFSALSLVLIIAVFAAPLALGRGAARARSWVPVAATLSGVLCASKVLSPQFFVFLMPLLAAACSELPDAKVWIGAMLVLAVLTTAGYPLLYEDLLSLRIGAWLLVAARNAVLLLVTGFLYWAWLGPGRSPHSLWSLSAALR